MSNSGFRILMALCDLAESGGSDALDFFEFGAEVGLVGEFEFSGEFLDGCAFAEAEPGHDHALIAQPVSGGDFQRLPDGAFERAQADAEGCRHFAWVEFLPPDKTGDGKLHTFARTVISPKATIKSQTSPGGR